jgi:hypothetical protein
MDYYKTMEEEVVAPEKEKWEEEEVIMFWLLVSLLPSPSNFQLMSTLLLTVNMCYMFRPIWPSSIVIVVF